MKLKRLLAFGALGLCVLSSFPAGAESAPATTLLTTSLPGVDGRSHSVSDWQGKIRVVNFWATWCAPCRNEIPALSAARRTWQKKGVEVIGVAIDGADDVRAYVGQAHVDYPILLGDQQGQLMMHAGGNTIGAMPFTVLLDRDGKIIQRHAGALDEKMLKQWLAQAAATN